MRRVGRVRGLGLGRIRESRGCVRGPGGCVCRADFRGAGLPPAAVATASWAGEMVRNVWRSEQLSILPGVRF